MDGKYDDIMDLPHPSSPRHPRMAKTDRAAQFAPFSALTGYEEAIGESGRLTQGETELQEDERELLDRQLRYLYHHPGCRAAVTFFVPDERKRGGAYRKTEEKVLKVDPERQLLITETRKIPMKDIRDLRIEGWDL